MRADITVHLSTEQRLKLSEALRNSRALMLRIKGEATEPPEPFGPEVTIVILWPDTVQCEGEGNVRIYE